MLGHAEIVGAAFRMIPVRTWRERLGRHIDRCPACQARLASREDARRVLFRSGDAGRMDGFWASVREKIAAVTRLPAQAAAGRGEPALRRGAWRWATAALGLSAAALLTVGLVRYFAAGSGTSGRGPEKGFEIHYARIAGEPAETIIIRPPDEGTVIVWVERF
jgi:anti-sigma factor RsiW